MEGKKKKRGGLLIAKPDYKKAYVTLKHPLSLSPDLYPIHIIEEDKKAMNKQSKSSIVEEGEVRSHWLDGQGNNRYNKPGKQSNYRDNQSNFREKQSNYRGGHGSRGDLDIRTIKFPWSNMPTSSK